MITILTIIKKHCVEIIENQYMDAFIKFQSWKL